MPSDPQLSFDELGTPLREVTFAVLDLETTGGSARLHAITEVGAVKVRGGERVGELGTLVDPGIAIPPDIARLTGITTSMVGAAPPLPAVLPSVLEFLSGSVLVAHNAPFDAGFLRAACEQLGHAWPRPPVLCTARLARAVLPRSECPSVRLGALAAHFGCATEPNHRALTDARATVEVLHHLLERIGNLGVQSLEELLSLARTASAHRPTQRQRQQRHLARDVPSAPGVYLFRGTGDEVLYVGTSGDLHRRVRSYFTAGERRRRIRDMVAQAQRVDTVVCAHALEAGVRELRLISAHRPRYNRRSRNPGRAWWVAPTAEAFPRLSVVATPREGALGPFASQRVASDAVDVALDAVALRRCSQRIPARDPSASPCALHELGHCAAPCAGHQGIDEYAPAVHAWHDLVSGADDTPLRTLAATVAQRSADERYESAARARDRLAGLVGGLDRAQTLATVAALEEVVGARPDGRGGWELAVLRFGRLAAAGVAPRGVRPMPVVESLRTGAQTVLPGPGPLRGAPPEEVRLLYRWLTTGGTRLVRCDPSWAEPARGAGSWREWAETARAAAGSDGAAAPSERSLGGSEERPATGPDVSRARLH
ncbi:DEDD exonuclease domain-containing protein [Pseudonocardia sp. KRD291]|uniref:DEDD exonuclease domain-containing protein n=1 Tax=Pseudonocardia sp. KRD291 TaxID=2792007 RepID=UPI001C4A3488|nr:DEDD exonuclease domain-containing protein [Pseudonocardia sp. KRD291]MBW0102021.1 DEDD exonuclease domain-containing protein [Pseudonocardia sp. KRD291]